MKTIYYSGMPYSPSLYHYGTKGMHWYQRLYQNPDGSLTPLGRVHYGVGKAAKATGRVAGKAIVATGKAAGKAGKAVGKQVANRVKARYPWMMSDQELEDRMRRVNMEKTYKQAMRDVRSTTGKKYVQSVMEDAGKTLAGAVFRGIGGKIESKMRLQSELKAIEAKKDAEMARYASDQRIKAKGDSLYDFTRPKELNRLVERELLKSKLPILDLSKGAKGIRNDIVDRRNQIKDYKQQIRTQRSQLAKRTSDFYENIGKNNMSDKELMDELARINAMRTILGYNPYDSKKKK